MKTPTNEKLEINDIVKFISTTKNVTFTLLQKQFHIGNTKTKQVLQEIDDAGLLIQTQNANRCNIYNIDITAIGKNKKISDCKIDDWVYEMIEKHGKTVCPKKLIARYGKNNLLHTLKLHGFDCTIEKGSSDKESYYISINKK